MTGVGHERPRGGLQLRPTGAGICAGHVARGGRALPHRCGQRRPAGALRPVLHHVVAETQEAFTHLSSIHMLQVVGCSLVVLSTMTVMIGLRCRPMKNDRVTHNYFPFTFSWFIQYFL